MAKNLVETIQHNLGYPELQKIDPNTQEVKGSDSTAGEKNPGQAAIPAVLLALYKYGNTEKGSEDILRGNNSTDWVSIFFGDNKEEAVKHVAAYAGNSTEDTASKMEEIAREAVRLIREQTPEAANFLDVKSYVAQQRNSILTYLPAELQMSALVNDNTLDDRTNKMEGPMSNSMHFIEKLFSGSTTEKYERTEEDDENK